MNHPAHPKCSCGRALYKSATKGAKVGKSDPWAFCRNEACPKCGVDQAAEGPKLTPGVAKEVARRKAETTPATAPSGKPRAKGRRKIRRRTVPAPGVPPTQSEPLAVQKARERIRGIVQSLVQDKERSAVQLVLAMVNQETGNTAAANLIIAEYKLDELFGLKRF